MPDRTIPSTSLPRDLEAALRRLRRHGLGSITARGVERPLEVDRRGRLGAKVRGALAVDAFGNLVVRLGEELEATPGSPVAIRLRLSGPLELDPQTRAVRLAPDTIRQLLLDDPRDGDLFLWKDGHMRAYRDGATGEALRRQANGTWKAQALPTVVTDHGALLGLADDDHPQYRPHLEIPFQVLANASATWAGQPAAATFFLGSHRHVVAVDLSLYNQARLVVNKQATPARAGAMLRVKYRSAFSTAVGDYAELADAGSIEVAIDVADDVVKSAWTDIAALAKADVFLCLEGTGGDGVVSPAFGNVHVQVRK